MASTTTFVVEHAPCLAGAASSTLLSSPQPPASRQQPCSAPPAMCRALPLAPHCLRPPTAVRRALLANGLEYAGDFSLHSKELFELRRSVRGTPLCAHVIAREILPRARDRMLTCAVPGCCVPQETVRFELGAAV